MASLEIDHIDKYIQDSGINHRLGSGYRRPSITKLNGLTSRHGWPGTNGGGLARDIAGPRPGVDTPELLAIFNAFFKVRGQLRELYYSGPGVTHNVQRGAVVPLSKVSATTRRNHHNHVHVAVTRGTFIRWSGPVLSVPSSLKPGLVSSVDIGVAVKSELVNVKLINGEGWLDLHSVPVDNFVSASVNGSDGGFPRTFFAPQNVEGHLRIKIKTADVDDGVIGVRYVVA